MKFWFDRIMAFIGIMLFIPFFIIISLYVMFDLRTWKPIFSQDRVGKDGKIFKIYKIRTIKGIDKNLCYVDGNAKENTQFGRFLRKSKINELTELFNVFIGDMSFVGPRPDVPGYADKLKGEDRKILSLRPGITCEASIKYANEDEILATKDNPKEYNDSVIYPDKVRINMEYYRNHTFCGDMKIIYKTIISII